MKRHIVFIVLALMLSCKEEPKAAVQTEPEVVAQPELIVKIEFKTNKEDVIILELDDIIVDEFQKKKIQISEKVLPTTTSEVITGNFEHNTSRKFVIDLGQKETKEFEIVSLSFHYGENDVNIQPADLETYFGFSKFTSFDKTTKKITTQKVDNVHYPRLYARGILWDQLVNRN